MKHSLKKLMAEMARECALSVISELNSPRVLENAAVERLADTLTHLHRLRLKEARGESIHPDELNPVNEYLACYRWIEQLVVTSYPVLYFQHQAVLGEPGDVAAANREHNLADLVVGATSNGTLDRIHRCDECGVWFYARRRPYDPAAGTFCSIPHQQKFWRSKPEVKSRRRDYGRRYYRDELSPVTRKTRKRRRK